MNVPGRTWVKLLKPRSLPSTAVRYPQRINTAVLLHAKKTWNLSYPLYYLLPLASYFTSLERYFGPQNSSASLHHVRAAGLSGLSAPFPRLWLGLAVPLLQASWYASQLFLFWSRLLQIMLNFPAMLPGHLYCFSGRLWSRLAIHGCG